MKTDQLIFSSEHCDQLDCTIFTLRQRIIKLAEDKTVITEPSKYTIMKRQRTPLKKVMSIKKLNTSAVSEAQLTSLLSDQISDSSVNIAIIDTAAFNRLNTKQHHQNRVQLFFMTIQEMERVLKRHSVINTEKVSECHISALFMEKVLIKISSQYLDLKDAFD